MILVKRGVLSMVIDRLRGSTILQVDYRYPDELAEQNPRAYSSAIELAMGRDELREYLREMGHFRVQEHLACVC